MQDKLCFVQFMHTGDEHNPGADGRMAWNAGAHRRKFLAGKGRRVANGKMTVGDLAFWGEWEAQSRAIPFPSRPTRDHPRFLHYPHYVIPSSYDGLQNTDPFVFGTQFHYTGCLQNTKRGPTQLRNLTMGSVVLFGAHKDGRFLLDTVFVVKRFVDHDRRSYERVLRGSVSDVYWDVTVQPWYFGRTCGPGESYRLYYGATYEDPQNGMYSFIPALPLSSKEGFARPAIAIAGLINGALTQGKKLNPQTSATQVRTLWEEVSRQVTANGLDLGVNMEPPPRLWTTL